MVTDIAEEDDGQFAIWGVSGSGSSVLVTATGFQPYLYVAAPSPVRDPVAPSGQVAQSELPDALCQRLNQALPPDARLDSVESCRRTPLLYYRPADSSAEGAPFLKFVLRPGASLRRLAGALPGLLQSAAVLELGWRFEDTTLFEADVSLLQRFLADVPLSGRVARGARRQLLIVVCSGSVCIYF